jgi:hypothetical protein
MDKIVKCTTDNGSNFVKAFKEYARELHDIEEVESSSEDEDAAVNNEDVDMIDDCLNLANDGIEDEQRITVLPPHQRCASHTLSLICTVDVNKKTSRLQKSAFGKCYGIWNKSSRSTKFSEVIKDICGVYLKTPCVTRWNSLYDSLRCLLTQKHNLTKLCTGLGVPLLQEREIEFIEQYCDCVKPIAEALDRLQGEDRTFYGELIPTVFAVEKKLRAQINSNPKHCEWLPQVLLHGIQNRFKAYLELTSDVNDAIMASVSHPTMKLKWVPTEKYEAIKSSFISKAVAFSVQNFGQDETASVADEDDCHDDDFYAFVQSGQSSQHQSSGAITVEQEVLNYLRDNGNKLETLERYPLVKKLFVKYNTPLPSSGPVERLFSYSSMILSPKRNQTNDKLFEKITLLKVNNF